ncbi:MAG: family 1 glycosylhydrolase [Candidatus Ryanbacteria bacterium]|nr:family 1 glycosylhydrolase [Candidatus Ryanbacteria bacterium]
MEKRTSQKVYFFWGAATSAHQVEGGNRNDWSAWEDAHGLEKSGQACDHYNRFREDFDIAKSLGHNAHRFSIEWSRIEPREGEFDEHEIQHYREVLSALRERGIEPFVTLWHWTIPIWFRDKGGLASKKAPMHFARYVERIVAALGSPTSNGEVGLPLVRRWITLNETNVYTGNGYWKGIWPPGERSFVRYIVSNHRLSVAHCKAYEVIKKINPAAEVGVAHSMIYFTKFGAAIKRYIYNNLFLNSIRAHQDFVGINYYFSDRDTPEKSDMDWPIDSDGFYEVLRRASSYKKPIYILENGIADAKDEKRAKFIHDHVEAMQKAMREGADVRGYFYWSLLDNFEWAHGFAPRFGLVHVDYKTMERTVRASALEYKSLIVK